MDVELVKCEICSRKFYPNIIEKHRRICIKASNRNIKIFDSGKQRATGTGISLNKTIRPGKIAPDEIQDEKLIKVQMRKHNWRQKHEEFIKNIRAAKEYSAAKAKGGPLPPPPSATINPDFVQCDYCKRHFNEKAADRHIPFCKEQHSRIATSVPHVKKTSGTVNYPLNNKKSINQIPPPDRVTSNNSQSIHSPPNLKKLSKPHVNRDAMSSVKVKNTLTELGDTQPRMPSSRRNVPHQRCKNNPDSAYIGRHPQLGRNLMQNFTGSKKIGRPGPLTDTHLCHECGTHYPGITNKFCPECGVRRLAI